MVDITLDIETPLSEPSPARQRSIFALGWVRFKSPAGSVPARDDEVRVLGLMVVKDTVESCPMINEELAG